MPDLGIDFAAGCIGGAAGVLAGHPLDTVKVRLQMQGCRSVCTYKGTFHCLGTIAKTEGLRGLYKGLSSPLSSVAFINAIIFGVHGHVSKSFTDKQSILTHFAAGASAGFAQAFIASPSEMLKLRVQLNLKVPNKLNTVASSPYQCFKNIIRQHGYKSLKRGMLATQLRDTTGIGIYFASYETLARRMSKDGQMESLTSIQLLLAGGMAGTFSWMFNYPVDVIKTRFQADDSHKSYVQVVNKMYAEQGLRTFFVGLSPTLIRAFPTNAATFFTVEWTYRLLIDYDLLGKIFSCSLPDRTTTEFLPAACSSSTQPNNTKPSPARLHIPREDYISGYELWNNLGLLPEAGSTLIDIDPISINRYRVCVV